MPCYLININGVHTTISYAYNTTTSFLFLQLHQSSWDVYYQNDDSADHKRFLLLVHHVRVEREGEAFPRGIDVRSNREVLPDHLPHADVVGVSEQKELLGNGEVRTFAPLLLRQFKQSHAQSVLDFITGWEVANVRKPVRLDYLSEVFLLLF